MNIYEYSDYRVFLRERVEAGKVSRTKLTYAQLAKAMRIQRSYLSQVLSGAHTLNADQLYLAAEEIGLSEKEREFLLLLLEIDRSQVPGRRDQLVKRCAELREEHTRSEHYLTSDLFVKESLQDNEYFQDPLTALVHVFLMIKTYRTNPPKLAAKLAISAERLEATFKILERAGMLKYTAQGIDVCVRSLHLAKTSPLTAYHGTYFRHHGIAELQNRRDENSYFFTTTFSATEGTRERIRLAFLALLREASSWIAGAKEEQAFQLNFDLFRF